MNVLSATRPKSVWINPRRVSAYGRVSKSRPATGFVELLRVVFLLRRLSDRRTHEPARLSIT